MPRKTVGILCILDIAPPAASMRPRPDAAENPKTRPTNARPATCFNEAAARCRGKPTRRRLAYSAASVLQ